MFAKPQEQHRWLEQFVGEWTFEAECVSGPDQPPSKHTGRTKAYSLGGLWTLFESEQPGPDDSSMKSIITLGYDPQSQKFVGSFVASVMTFFWVYSGTLDSAQRKLVLDATGPRFDRNEMTQYHDIIELVSKDHWILSSEMLSDDGKWLPFMSSHYRRVS